MFSERPRGQNSNRRTTQTRPTGSIRVAPPYQKPENQLTDVAQRKLDALHRKYAQRDTKAKFKKAADMVADSCYQIKSEQGKDTTSGSSAKTRRAKDHWKDFGKNADRYVGAAEEKIRKACDAQERHEWIVEGIKGANGPVGAATANTQMSSFNATLPGATAGTQNHPGAMEHYKMIVQQKKDAYGSKSLYSRYAEHEDYEHFKTSLHEGYYGEDGPETMPKKSTWFEDEEPAPGTTRDGLGSDSDSDLEVARVKISTKCPLTLREFEEPVTTKTCMHSFERSAILEMLGSKPHVQCPVTGCPNHITKAQLRPDQNLIRRIKRLQERQRRAQELQALNNADRQGQNMDDSIMLSDTEDGPDADGFMRLDEGERAVKNEPKSQQMQRNRMGGTLPPSSIRRTQQLPERTQSSQAPRSSAAVMIELDTESSDDD